MRTPLLIGLTGCVIGPPPGPVLTACDRFFLDVIEDTCEGVDKSYATCESLACSQASLTFDTVCRDPEACCVYRDCWDTWESCMARCTDDSQVERCLDELGACATDELSK
ncbi:MAG: hypothetical protein AAF211_25310 [Myxococcota bacterium]